MSGCVYHIFCTQNGKAYVGQTWQPVERRWAQHFWPSTGCVRLVRALRKYGKKAFVFSVLTRCDTQEDLDAAEAYWITHFDCVANGYNIKAGGSRGRHSAETRAKLSAFRQKWIKTPEGRSSLEKLQRTCCTKESNAKKSLAHRRLVETPEGRQLLDRAIAAANSEEANVRKSRSHGGRPFCDDTGTRYETLGQAARSLGLNAANIHKVLSGKARSAGGRTFRYLGVSDG